MGPVINEGAMKSILEYVEVGKKEGRLVAGGAKAPGDGYFVQPTVIADIDSKARIFQEEIFGPVLAVAKARDFDHALEMANDSEYGLTGAVYTNNKEKIRKAREQFFVGNLYINRKCTGAMVGAHPFGGFNMSGTDSKAGGPDYLLQFLQAKVDRRKDFVITSAKVGCSESRGAPMRRGLRRHNSRVDSERRGEGRTIISAPFSIRQPSLTGRDSEPRVSKRPVLADGLFQRVGIGVGIPRLVAVQALKILFDQDGQALAGFERLLARDADAVRTGPIGGVGAWNLDAQPAVARRELEAR